MNAKEIVKAAIAESGMSFATIAKEAGYKRSSNVSEIIRAGNMRVDSMLRILEVCGCEVIIRSNKKGVPDRKVELE